MNNISTLLGIVVVGVLALALLQYLSRPQGYYNEGELDTAQDDSTGGVNVVHGIKDREPDDAASVDPRAGNGYIREPMAMSGDTNLVGGSLQGQLSVDQNPSVQQLRAASCFPKEVLMPQELLPQDNGGIWGQVNPQGAGSLMDKNFLQAGYLIGINTVGQTLRNANLQLRSEPPNPQVPVSPWMQSSIEPDTNRKPLEIGGCM